MPKKLINDYTFYKIICLDKSVDLCYVGSTANWKQRQTSHKYNCNNNENSKVYNTKVYKTIRENGGWSNFKMIEIGKQEQLTLREAENIEEQYRVELNANMNDRRCFVTKEQKKEEHKERIKEWCKNNPEYHKDYRKEYDQTEHSKALKVIANKKYNESEHGKANKAFLNKNYRDKKKAELALNLSPQL
tara:strand:+ start:297 stop:863 length:567 start_codon:yes stop_codon:yes gene_type:complete